MSTQIVRAAATATGAALLMAAAMPAAVRGQDPARPAAAAATGQVRGRVLEAGTQRPVADAQVQVVGTQVGAITNSAGEFTLRVPAGTRTLRVRRIGFGVATQAVTVAEGGEARADFTLSAAASQLDQVVVTGTGAATTRRTLGNAVTTIDAAQLTQENSISNVSEILQSKTPGVTILPGSGTPGAAGEVRIRGNNSLSGSRPVIFIDGIRMSNEGLGNFNPTGSGTGGVAAAGQAQASQITSGLDFINPEDIESIEVIKGPAAATLYGADASAGVIQIITKRGARGNQRPQYTARGELGANTWALPTLTNYLTCDAGRIAARSTVEGQSVPTYTGCQGKTPGTVLTQNPLALDPNALRTGDIQRLNLGVRGGSDRFSYFVSADRDDEYGVYFNSENRRKAGRGNFTVVPNDKTEIRVNVSYGQNDLLLPPQDESIIGVLLNSSRSQPGLRPQTTSRTVFVGSDTIVYSNQAPFRANAYNNRTRSDRLILGATLDYRPISWFRNRVTVGTDQTFSTADVLVLPGDEFEPVGSVLERTPRIRNYTVDYNGRPSPTAPPAFGGSRRFCTQDHRPPNVRLDRESGRPRRARREHIGSAQVHGGSNTFSENQESVGYYVQQQSATRTACS
jgi:TonB-dependent SusC/RagA subfamily outer membrane receptor